MGKTKYINPCYCLKLRRASNEITNFYDRILAESGVTISQYSILLNLSHAERGSISELAELSDRDRSTIARNIKPLLRAGLIFDDKDPCARDSRLKLTEKGQSVLYEASILWDKAQKEVNTALGEDGIKTLERLLETLEKL